MASYPGTPVNPPAFQVEFDYSVWTPGTTATLVNVPWDSSYRDVVRFSSESAKASYFASLALAASAIQINSMVYLRYGEPIRVAIPFSEVNRCNYIVVKNPVQPVPSYGKTQKPDTFYYFVNDVRYVSPNTTELDVQLDVWTTYSNRITFGTCYVERGHIGIANENSTIRNLADYLTEPEGFEIGSEYDIVGQQWQGFQSAESCVVVLSTVDLTGDLGTIDKPNLVTATGDAIDGMLSGCNGYVFTASSFLNAMKSLSVFSWAAQGIVCILAMPTEFVRFGEPVKVAGINCWRINPNHPQVTQTWVYLDVLSGMRIPARYSQLLKFYTHPFSCLELTNFTGAPIVLKPEMLTYDADSLHMTMQGSYMPSGARFYAYPSRINSTISSTAFSYKPLYGSVINSVIDGGEFLDCALIYDNFPQFSVVNNGYMAYLAGTANTRAYSYAAADWSQQKALTGAQLAFDQSTVATDIGLANNAVSLNAAWANNSIANEQATVGGVTGALSGAGSALSGNAVGGVVQAAGALANAALATSWNNQRTAINTTAQNIQASNAAGQARYNRDTNYDYASFAAKGDYANTIAAIQAKVDDARLTQPSVSGQNGGQLANYACGLFGCLMRQKRIKTHFLNQIGEYWLRYGYAIGRWIKPPADLRCMTKVTYWKMQNCMLFGELPELHKNAIRGIFESGVSIWTNPSEINNIDLGENKTVSGVRY